MELVIGKKIAELRRESGKTQEQLANYVNVSTTAVSKWETGHSHPDITLLPAIADFFEVSIDALLGHQVISNERALIKIRQNVMDYVVNADFARGLPIIEKALEKYPNDFSLLCGAASLVRTKADRSETPTEDYKLAIDYCERAIDCAPNSKLRTQIKAQISNILKSMGEYDQAITLLEKINDNGHYNQKIAHLKFEMGDIPAAKKMLQEDLWGIALGLFGTAGFLGWCFEKEGNYEMAIDVEKLHTTFLAGFIHDTPNYADFICTGSYKQIAEYYMCINNTSEMRANLEKAAYHAIRYDENPSIKGSDIKFMDGLYDGGNKMAHTCSSETLSCHGLLRALKEKFADFAAEAWHIELCSKLDSAKKTKVEANIW